MPEAIHRNSGGCDKIKKIYDDENAEGVIQ
jgi:hypothetical protein